MNYHHCLTVRLRCLFFAECKQSWLLKVVAYLEITVKYVTKLYVDFEINRWSLKYFTMLSAFLLNTHRTFVCPASTFRATFKAKQETAFGQINSGRATSCWSMLGLIWIAQGLTVRTACARARVGMYSQIEGLLLCSFQWSNREESGVGLTGSGSGFSAFLRVQTDESEISARTGQC